MLSDEPFGGCAHRTKVERFGDVYGEAVQERVGRLRAVQVVLVLATFRAEPRVEGVGNRRGAADRYFGTEPLVQTGSDPRGIGSVGSFERDDLPGGMHPGVRSPRAGRPNGHPQQLRQRLLEQALNRAPCRLASEAVEVGAVVREEERELRGYSSSASPTNSIRAIGAASPLRGPSFTIRV